MASRSITIKPRMGRSDQVTAHNTAFGELIYLTDEKCLAIGDGKGGFSVLSQVVKGPDDGLYMKSKNNEYVPITIKLTIVR